MKKSLITAVSMMLLGGCGTAAPANLAAGAPPALAAHAAGSAYATRAQSYMDDPGKGFHRNVTDQALLALDFATLGTAASKQKAAQWLASAETEMKQPNGLSERDALSASMLALAHLAVGGPDAQKAAAAYLDAPGKGFHRNVTDQALLSLAFSTLGTADAKQKAAAWLASAEQELKQPNNAAGKDGRSAAMLAIAHLAQGGPEAKKAAGAYLAGTDQAFHRNVTEQALLSVAFSRLGTPEGKQKAAKWLASAEAEMKQPYGLSDKDALSAPMLAWALLSMQ